MLTFITDFGRLLRAGWMLSRKDALAPRELEPLMPPSIKALARFTRIGVGKTKGRPGERMASVFEKQGPAYVKLGQFMATRPDIIGHELAADLGRLQDRMPAFSQEEAKATIHDTLNQEADDIFAEFSEPVAAASIAQAHKAKLPTGESVAVKILRPKIEQTAKKEFRAFGRAAWLLERVSAAARRMEAVKFIETLKASAAIELDLRMEAGAASELADNLKDDPNVRLPRVHWSHCGRRVLTIEWIDGVSISDEAGLDRLKIDRKKLAVDIMRIFLTQALRDGFFHADMHQGNIIIDNDGRVALIDFGIMGRLDLHTRDTFAEILYGFIIRDYQRTADVHFSAGYISKEYSREAFAQALRAIGEPLQGRNANQVDMSRVLQQLFDVTELFDMHLRPELILLQRTMVTVEGVARMLDPEIDMWAAASPVVSDYIRRSAGPAGAVRRVRSTADALLRAGEKLPQTLDDVAEAARLIKADADRRQHSWSRMRNLLIAGGVIAIALYFWSQA